MSYNFSNFFEGTAANFTLCEIPDRDPDYVSFCGSAYWDYGDKVRRWSDHWGKNIASCCWYLDFCQFDQLKQSLCGECLYEDFRPNPGSEIATGVADTATFAV
jgi:hypothetical protein